MRLLWHPVSHSIIILYVWERRVSIEISIFFYFTLLCGDFKEREFTACGKISIVHNRNHQYLVEWLLRFVRFFVIIWHIKKLFRRKVVVNSVVIPNYNPKLWEINSSIHYRRCNTFIASSSHNSIVMITQSMSSMEITTRKLTEEVNAC